MKQSKYICKQTCHINIHPFGGVGKKNCRVYFGMANGKLYVQESKHAWRIIIVWWWLPTCTLFNRLWLIDFNQLFIRFDFNLTLCGFCNKVLHTHFLSFSFLAFPLSAYFLFIRRINIENGILPSSFLSCTFLECLWLRSICKIKIRVFTNDRFV